MQIQKNSRQIPKKDDIVSNKNYCDLIYSWLQCNSELDESFNVRYILRQNINYSSIGKELGMDRRTAGRYIERLFNMGLLVEEQGKVILKELERNTATLVPYLTLRKIQNSLHRNSVSIFVYLLNRYLACDETAFFITYGELKRYIGIATTTGSNNVVISDILEVLQLLKLIDYKIVQTDVNKINIRILKVNNMLPK